MWPHFAEGFYRRISLNTEHFIKARQLLASMNSSLRALEALHLFRGTRRGDDARDGRSGICASGEASQR
jgi:hypothetical protein